MCQDMDATDKENAMFKVYIGGFQTGFNFATREEAEAHICQNFKDTDDSPYIEDHTPVSVECNGQGG
jgi:hypothetical protein